jgi:hypothetical protein
MLAAGEKSFAPLICEDVADKLWNDSERTGRRPNYSERHSTIVGFTSNFVDKTGTGEEEGEGERGEADRSLEKRGGRSGRGAPGESDGEGASGGREGREQEWNFEEQETGREEDEGEEKKEGGESFRANKPQPRANLLKKSKRSSSTGEDKGQVVKGAQLLQKKLERCWTILQFPMIKKLQFLEKYAHRDFSMKLPAAVRLWELASVAVPVRESCLRLVRDMDEGIRVSPVDVRSKLKWSILEEMNCSVKLPESFLFEERLDEGNVTSEELLEYASIFDKRGTDQDDYLTDCTAWLSEVLGKLNDNVSSLSRKMKDEVEEDLSFKGLVYDVK